MKQSAYNGRVGRIQSRWVSFAAAFLSAAFVPVMCAQSSGSGSGAPGAGSATSNAPASATGQNAASPASGQTGAHGAQAAPAEQQVAPGPQTYAAGAAPGADPRKPPAAAPGALTLQQVIDRAKSSNPTLLAAEANLRSVRAQEIQAGVRQNPYFGFAGQEISEPPSAPTPYTYSAQISRLFERGNKREYRLQDARATTAQTAAQLNDTIRQTLLQVKTAFTNMLFAKQALILSKAQLADFRHEVDIAHDRFTAGDLGKLDFERLDLQLGSFESDAANDTIALQQASDQLQTLMGIASPSRDFDITGDIVPPLITQTREQLITEALASRPDLAAAHAGVDVANAAYRLAIANGTADPTIEGEFERAGPENSVGFNINIPIRIFDRNQGNKETARIAIDAAQMTETAARNQISSDVDQAWVSYVQAKSLSDRFGNHYLDESADVLSIARFAFDHGGIALIDYLDSLRDARSSTSDALNAYQQTWIAIHQLSAASATELIP